MLCNCFALRLFHFFPSSFVYFWFITRGLTLFKQMPSTRKNALTLAHHQQNTSAAYYLLVRLNLAYYPPRIINDSYTVFVDSSESQEITATFCTFINFEKRSSFPLGLSLFCCVLFLLFQCFRLAIVFSCELFNLLGVFASVSFASFVGSVKMFRKLNVFPGKCNAFVEFC